MKAGRGIKKRKRKRGKRRESVGRHADIVTKVVDENSVDLYQVQNKVEGTVLTFIGQG